MKRFTFCAKCCHKLAQPNLFRHNEFELVGCQKMSKEHFDKEEERNKHCPALSESYEKKEKELTDAQIERLDFVHNTIFDCIQSLVGHKQDKKLEWDMEIIGEVADVICNYVVEKELYTEMEFLPYVEI